jgi:hypothetical protein
MPGVLSHLLMDLNINVQFDKLVEQLLTEMPYIEINNQIIDLEVEKYKNNPEEFVQLLKRIINGEKVIGGHGSIMHLTTPEEKQDFLKKIKLNYIIRGVIPGDLIDSL